jgi:hypothetical protein
MGTFGIDIGINLGDFFGAILSSIIAVINAIIGALSALIQILQTVLSAIYSALQAVAAAVWSAIKLIARGFIHVISDIIHGRFLHLLQDYIDLKNKLAELLAPILKILQTIRKYFNQFVLVPLLRYINLIQQIRQFLTIFRLLGFKWAVKLDAYLVKQEQMIVTNTLVLQSWLNFTIDILDLIADPSLILRKNFLLASLLSYLGAIKRIVFFGGSRTQSPAEKAQASQDHAALAPQTHILQVGFGTGAQYYPTAQSLLPGMDAALAYYMGGAHDG